MHTFQKMKQYNESNTSIGRPKLCVSLMGETLDDIRIKAQRINESPADILEFRADSYKGDLYKDLFAIFSAIKEAFKGELLFTLRSDENGKFGDLSVDTAKNILMNALASESVDMVDIEYRLVLDDNATMDKIKSGNVAVVLSEHEYEGNFTADYIYDKLNKLGRFNTDMIKYVIMPKSKDDVMHLMEGVIRYKEDYPNSHVIAHAMGEIGLISRLSAEVIGSEIVFAALDDISAPGQIDVNMMKTCLDTIHEQLISGED